ncbi:MAG TPA: trypsin-like peptidase domain-containing protein [Sphingobacteriaceae bacterium]
MKNFGIIAGTALLSAAVAIGAYRVIDNEGDHDRGVLDQTQDVYFTSNPTSAGTPLPDFNFVGAAAAATPGVVHIRTTYNSGGGSQSPWSEFFGIPQGNMPSRGSGSGVIITGDGYIATNNHVVEDASQIEVVLPNKRTFKAKLVGRDPNTDLALVKIEGKDLPVVKIGNSDNVQIGEWVLAIGYPFSLNTTVTAGIISAKGRSIGILDETQQQGGVQTSTAIESFIQTDAAINPGNSGGALVNSNGELIGINAAIASQTGSYAGYGFAIPANLAKKILEDLIKFGTVKRAYLGVTFPAPAAEEQFLRERGINPGSVRGVYITGIQSNSAAAAAGLKAGDIIQSIDGVKVASSAEFSERIGRHRPGDKVELTYLRANKTQTVNVTLKGGSDTRLADNSSNAVEEAFNKLGAKFQPASANLKQRLRVSAGVVVTDVVDGGFFDYIGLPEGTVITSMGGMPVNSENDIKQALGRARSGVIRVNAVIPDGSRLIFNLSFGA